MSLSDRSLVRRTLVHVAAFVGGSVLLIGLLSAVLISVARAILPAQEEPAEEEAPPAATSRAASARGVRPARRDEEPASDEGERARPAPDKPEVDRWPQCCDALDDIAKSAPSGEKGTYLAAASACRGLAGSPRGRQVIQNMLDERPLPDACE